MLCIFIKSPFLNKTAVACPKPERKSIRTSAGIGRPGAAATSVDLESILDLGVLFLADLDLGFLFDFAIYNILLPTLKFRFRLAGFIEIHQCDREGHD